MALRLRGSTSGYAEIDAPAVAGDVTLTLPTTTGTINVKDASGNTEVGTGVTFGNPGANIFTINNTGGERLRIAADGTVSIPGALNVSGVLTYEDVTSVDAIGLSTFRDGLNTKDVGITTISSTDVNNSGTATDIFIYDTSKDSDGGEWRKRTTHTSWYNEASGSKRSSRKDFPSVAVIVAEATQLTIYDGDDPDLPMWMVFDLSGSVGSSSNMLPRGNSGTESDITSIACLNGRLAVGLKDVSGTVGEGLVVIDFISELARVHRTSGSGYTGAIYSTPISGRNSSGTYSGDYNELAIIAETCNDVAMTVLPNAPIDDATGLPIPTIAVGTDAGLSVIRDNNTVIETTSEAEKINTVEFTEDYGINAHIDASTNANKALVYVDDIDKIDGLAYNSYANWDGVLWQSRYQATKILTFLTPNAQSASYPVSDFVSMSGRSAAIGSNFSDGGLTILEKIQKGGDAGQGMVAFASTSYNTGWMHGDIKGAFLSGISTASTTYGSELITNGTFDSNITGWTAFNSTLTHQTDSIRVADNGSWSKAYQSFTTEVGKEYLVKVVVKTISGGNAGAFAGAQNPAQTAGNDTQVVQFTTSTGTYYGLFTATATTSYVEVTSDGTSYVEYSEISVKENHSSLLDRSVNNFGLVQYGTITKTAVATGADLVGYSGFSGSNYLKQPYNSDLDFGTGEFSVTWWHKVTGDIVDTSYAFDRQGGSGYRFACYIYANNDGGIAFYTDGSAGALEVTYNGLNDYANTWICITLARTSSGRMQIYINGEQKVSTDKGVSNLNNTVAPLYIGIRHDETSSPADQDTMALMRFSSTIPSPEQIKKMYEDEKVLFQENAKATLYGSSDAVTALGYDEITDQLHVGTSAGRSDFQGLRRINNTTDPVSTAISAHDTFIIEQ